MSVWKKLFFSRELMWVFRKVLLNWCQFLCDTMLFLFLGKVVVIALLLFLILKPNMVVEEQKHDKVEVFCDWVLELLKIIFPSFNLYCIQKQCGEYSNLQRHKLTLHSMEIERSKTFVKLVFLK